MTKILVLPEYNKPYLIDSLTAPIVIKHHWTFNALACDFFMTPIHYLEETTGAALKVRINNLEFWVPASWNILVTDLDTYQLDTVPINTCASIKHHAFVFVAEELKLRTLDVMVLDYSPEMSLVHPMIAKGTAMIHPVGILPSLGNKHIHASIVIGPYDLYKQLNGKVVGDVFG